jgi:phosphoglycolate phosphatase
MTNSKYALIFDLDGTLIDSAPDLKTACNKLLAQYNLPKITLEDTHHFVGNGAQKLVERAFKHAGKEPSPEEIETRTQEFLAFYNGHEADETVLYDGVMEGLVTLRSLGFRMALCTNKPKAPTLSILKTLKLAPLFDVVIGGDEVAIKKPAPEMLLKALDEMDCSPDKTIMIGDSPNDIGAATNAQIKSIAVSYGYRKVSMGDLGGDYQVDKFSQIPDIIQSHFQK